MNKILLTLVVAILAILFSANSMAQYITDEMIKKARQCVFTEEIVNSIYSGSCMVPIGGPSAKAFKFFGETYSNFGGRVIGDVHVEPVYGINRFLEQKTKKNLLFFKKEVGRDGARPVWLVLDVLKLPRTKRGEGLFSSGLCKLNNIQDSEIIAIAKMENVRELRTIIKAWRTNRESGKFEPISVNNLSCEQECVGDECI